MATSNYDRVGKALEFLRAGLGPFVERELKGALEARRMDAQSLSRLAEDPLRARPVSEWDVAGLLKLMWENWNAVFREILGPAERGFVGEMRGHRNRWAHQESFSSDDAYRVLDSASRLLAAVSAPQAEECDKLKMELLRVRFDEQARGERRKHAASIESAAAAHLKPWREVVTPHPDVASGRYQQAEFAADLWQVHLDEGSAEYKNPVEFFRRTYLTDTLKHLLAGAVRRLSGGKGDPVVALQTNFGGGKTHSMLALYHLFSGIAPGELVDIEGVMQGAGLDRLPTVKRVVLVGNKISPGNPATKSDGTTVRTLWGELAWQLGGRAAFAHIQADDEKATNPGDILRELFNTYGPCLILIDEWVAYARQLHDQSDLPAGSFETQFTFAQSLTEAARAARNCLLVLSLPASDGGGSPHALVDDVEVGGQRGREALAGLQNVIGRLGAAWQPASAGEGFEIVRRRLFEPLAGPARFTDRDVVVRAFAELYRTQHQEFPPECRDLAYEKSILEAYPIHPEIFDRLYTDWSTLVKFQRTRGVLRLMASVIHSLWEKGDRNPIILPATVSIDDPRVRSELTRYLPDNWVPIIEKDVDGPNSLPLQIESQASNLGKLAAVRRVARTVYLGSAPTADAARRGLDDRRIKLGCVLPGESPAVFGDALRRLAGAASYLYQDGSRYWYSTQPTVMKLAEDRAEQLRREPDKLERELDVRLRAALRQAGDFRGVHVLPQSGQDVPDDLEARLVVLGRRQPHSREAESPARGAAEAILASRGNAPRLYRNTLVFLAADRTRLQDLDAAILSCLAWQSICDESEELNLSPQQRKQAEVQHNAASDAVHARLPETFQWVLAPTQETPQAALEWWTVRLSGQDALAVRASKRLKNDERLITALGAARLRMELDRVPLWRGDHVSVKQLVEDFARYPYLPRLKEPEVVLTAIRDGLGLLNWRQDGFAVAESYDEQNRRYRGLRAGQMLPHGQTVSPQADAPLVLVKPEPASRQLEAESAERATAEDDAPHTTRAGSQGPAAAGEEAAPYGPEGRSPRKTSSQEPAPPQPKRFYGTVALDVERVGRDAGQIAEEVIAHLTGLVGARVRVTLEVEADIPDGAPEQVVRTVTENSRTLRFTSQGFEQE